MNRNYSDKIKKEICCYLNKEENDFLTDKQLCELINEKGFEIAKHRITVYRQSLNIPSSEPSSKFPGSRKYLRYRYKKVIWRVDGLHIMEKKC